MGTGQESVYQRRLRKRESMTKEERKRLAELRKISEKKYRDKNRDKINRNLRQYNRELKEIAKELGVCNSCGEELDNVKYINCTKCREKFAEYIRRKRHGAR